jgi:hypothetical protein
MIGSVKRSSSSSIRVSGSKRLVQHDERIGDDVERDELRAVVWATPKERIESGGISRGRL